MADWTDWTTVFNRAVQRYGYAEGSYTVGRSYWEDADAYYDAANDHAALGSLIYAVMYNLDACLQLLAIAPCDDPDYSVLWCLKNIGKQITWRSICEAWAANDFEGRMVTIAFIDRMRQLLWNEPYSAQWAARPETEY